MPWLRVSALLSVILLAAAATARPAAPFDAFVAGLRSVCARPPASACATAITAYLDANRDGGVELAEIEAARAGARRAAGDEASTLNSAERSLIAVALAVFAYADLPKAFANFDADGDGRLSKAEMFADFRLDKRSFRDVVADPDGVDWTRFAARFGKVGALITDLVPPRGRK